MNATELLASPLIEGSPYWQMRHGERFALEGVLATLKPRLAIEIGTAEGGSLRRIASHSEEVHSFDIVAEIVGLEAELPNVRTHVGDSAVLVPEFLSGLEEEGRGVDFVLVDGDHSAAGVRRDAEALLASEACRRAVIVFHDSANDDVRAGLEAVRFEDYPHVAFANLDFISGYLAADPVRHLEIWNGLAIVVLDADRQEPPIEEPAFFDSALVLRQGRERAQARSGDGEAEPVQQAPEQAPASYAQMLARVDRRAKAAALASGALVVLATGLAVRRSSR